MIEFLIGLGLVLGLAVLIIPNAIRIVREYQRLVVFRLGRCIGIKGPGIVFLIPLVDKAVWVDLRELYLEIPHQTAITEDNAPISIDFIVFYKVVDAQASVLEVGNFAGAAQNIAATTLRSVVGDMALDDEDRRGPGRSAEGALGRGRGVLLLVPRHGERFGARACRTPSPPRW